ncbi:MAG TPA: MATE family efflux transporter [Vicinamibacterales bacterium]|jgi:MATE family multidrug resistance protein|nr:MATE family efflux transporter [Vicinamibacterales bacterium]
MTEDLVAAGGAPGKLQALRKELRPMLGLATPVVLAELGWVTMGIVDTVMVGPLGPAAIGAVGLAGMLFFAIAVFAMGLLLGLDPLVAQAFGARRIDECHRWLIDAIWLSALITVPVLAATAAVDASLGFLGLPSDVLAMTRPYLTIINWSLPPLLLYVAFRRYLQAMSIVRPVMTALVLGNIANTVANWALIYGHLGFPALGVRGSAFSTLVARIFMAAWLFGAVVLHEGSHAPRLRDTPMKFDRKRVQRLFALGLPAAGQAVLEVGVFAAATALAGRVSADALAAHQIALNMAAFTFMVPFGIASAAAVRVGQALGRSDGNGASTAGWTAISIGVSFMACAAAAFFLAPRPLLELFTRDEAVIELGVTLLFVAAVFQLFDGLQAVTTGALRGLADTRTPMLWNLTGHWLFGLPLGYTLCFVFGRGVAGLWWGLSAGLMVCGVALLVTWGRASALLPRRVRRTNG